MLKPADAGSDSQGNFTEPLRKSSASRIHVRLSTLRLPSSRALHPGILEQPALKGVFNIF
jgi:hypothetical protein